MRFREVQLQTFRNHKATRLECASGRNVLLGNNGVGKTNVLEAISYLCLTKSFYASSDATAVYIGEAGFNVSAKTVSDINVPYDIEVSYKKEGKEKKITINKGLIDDRSSVIGMFPVVILSPENANITSGMPGDRRRFIDVVISQSNKSYLQDLIEYRKILRQRNRILLESRGEQRVSQAVLEPWNEALVGRGAQISLHRSQFVEEFSPYLVNAFLDLAGSGEEPSIEYHSSIMANSSMGVEELKELFSGQLQRQLAEESRLGTTLVGPQKDDLSLEINGLNLRSFASQGQHKTFLVALKVAEFFYLRERCRETPVLLLDDVFSELDEPRSDKLLGLTAGLGQTFITATDGRRFSNATMTTSNFVRYYVRGGKVTLAEPAVVTN